LLAESLVKGASIYWLEKIAEAMLMLRSYYKLGRWNLLAETVVFLFGLTSGALTYFFEMCPS
jgi:hypothetical protein